MKPLKKKKRTLLEMQSAHKLQHRASCITENLTSIVEISQNILTLKQFDMIITIIIFSLVCYYIFKNDEDN